MDTPASTSKGSTSILTGVPPRDVLQKMLDTIGVKAKVELLSENGSTLLHITTADPSRLIGKQGHTLHQLQFLLNRMLHRANPDLPPLVVDCEHYRERQDDELLNQVKQSAEKVRRWGEPLRIGPFGTADRRVIQQHFDRDPELEVLSEPGDETERKKLLLRLRAAKPSA